MEGFTPDVFEQGIDDPNAPLEGEKRIDGLEPNNEQELPLTEEEQFLERLQGLQDNGVDILNKVEEGFSKQDKQRIYAAIREDTSEIKQNGKNPQGDKTYQALTEIMIEKGIDNPSEYLGSAPAYYEGTLQKGEEVAVDKEDVEADKRNEVADQLEKLIPMMPKIIETIDMKKEQGALDGFPNGGFLNAMPGSGGNAELEQVRGDETRANQY